MFPTVNTQFMPYVSTVVKKHLVSIVMCYYGRWDLTHARMNELYKYAPDNCEIILVNDASPDIDCRNGAAFWQKSHRLKVRYIQNEKNLGFGGSYNKGAKAARGDIIVLLSNDVVLSGDFISEIEKEIDAYEGDVVIGGRILWFDTGWNVLTINGKPSIIMYPEGWMIACTKEMWKRIGGFDPIFGLYDFEDVSVGAWCLYNDVPMIQTIGASKLHHIGGATINGVDPNRMMKTLENQKKFQEKWTKKFEEKLG